MEIKDGDERIRIEKGQGTRKKDTLLSVWNSHGLVYQKLLTPKQIERLHAWLGQRLTETL
jgi:hypothetical protein